MENPVKEMEPVLLWKYFAEMAAIPHGSGNEAGAIQWALDTAAKLGLEAQRDAVGNVVIRKKATPGKEAAPGVILQGHLDMVCEKNEDTVHDFTKDPLVLVRDGDYLRADGTTLGADNGIGVAAALALGEASDLVHGPLEFLFTVEEETGLTGANNLDGNMLQGQILLNLDTEEEGAIYVGCAGGLDSSASCDFVPVAATAGATAYRAKISGLKGGHSGMNIPDGLGNALKIMARIVRLAVPKFGMEVVSMNGGSKRNAIPREAFLVFRLNAAHEAGLRQALADLQADCRAEIGKADPDLLITMDKVEDAAGQVMTAADALKIANFLTAAPHGVLAMSPDIPGLVQTSTNLAIIATEGTKVRVHLNHRSSVESHRWYAGSLAAALCDLSGFHLDQGNGYPGWKPNLASQVLQTAKDVHVKLFGHEPEVRAIHAGLECGILGERRPGLDMISIGPNIYAVHSPSEKVSISSVATFWKYLTELLKTIAG